MQVDRANHFLQIVGLAPQFTEKLKRYRQVNQKAKALSAVPHPLKLITDWWICKYESGGSAWPEAFCPLTIETTAENAQSLPSQVLQAVKAGFGRV